MPVTSRRRRRTNRLVSATATSGQVLGVPRGFKEKRPNPAAAVLRTQTKAGAAPLDGGGAPQPLRPTTPRETPTGAVRTHAPGSQVLPGGSVGTQTGTKTTIRGPGVTVKPEDRRQPGVPNTRDTGKEDVLEEEFLSPGQEGFVTPEQMDIQLRKGGEQPAGITVTPSGSVQYKDAITGNTVIIGPRAGQQPQAPAAPAAQAAAAAPAAEMTLKDKDIFVESFRRASDDDEKIRLFDQAVERFPDFAKSDFARGFADAVEAKRAQATERAEAEATKAQAAATKAQEAVAAKAAAKIEKFGTNQAKILQRRLGKAKTAADRDRILAKSAEVLKRGGLELDQAFRDKHGIDDPTDIQLEDKVRLGRLTRGEIRDVGERLIRGKKVPTQTINFDPNREKTNPLQERYDEAVARGDIQKGETLVVQLDQGIKVKDRPPTKFKTFAEYESEQNMDADRAARAMLNPKSLLSDFADPSDAQQKAAREHEGLIVRHKQFSKTLRSAGVSRKEIEKQWLVSLHLEGGDLATAWLSQFKGKKLDAAKEADAEASIEADKRAKPVDDAAVKSATDAIRAAGGVPDDASIRQWLRDNGFKN